MACRYRFSAIWWPVFIDFLQFDGLDFIDFLQFHGLYFIDLLQFHGLYFIDFLQFHGLYFIIKNELLVFKGFAGG
jgi:hypothetical protein